MDSNKQEARITWVEFYFDMLGRFPHYRMEITWSNGNQYSFNIYDSDYWCDRLKYYLGVDWKANMDFFSNEHIEEAQCSRLNMLGQKAGVITSKKGFQYLTYL